MHEEPPASLGDWRRSYAHVFELSALGLAWEFVRRNSKIRDEWSALKPVWKEAIGDHGLKIVRGTVQPDTDCWWNSSPDEDATAASVFWSPSATARLLDVVSLPPSAAFHAQIFDLELFALEKTLLILPDGTQQLLLRDGAHSLQLNISGQSILAPVTLLVPAGLTEELSSTQTQLLKCFRLLRTNGTLPAECFPPHPYAGRAARVLMALDGHLAGVSHREIAVAMFGLERIKRDWGDPGEHLRDTVRRAIARGLVLMNGGYRTFLR